MENNLTGFIKEVLENILEYHEEDYNLNESQLVEIIETVDMDEDYITAIWEETEIAVINAINKLKEVE